MNNFLKNSLLVLGGVMLGSVVTQKRIIDALHSKDISLWQNQRECEEVLFETRQIAEDVLDCLERIISEYGHATLTDFYDLAGVHGSYEDSKFGWVTLRSARVVHKRYGYVIEFPKAMPIR